MSKNEVLWSQRAYAKSNTLNHFANFIYEFIGARFTFIAFIALFNFASIGLSFFDKILTSGIAIILFYLISDAFNVFWTGINLEYQISKKGIVYNWGLFRKHELLVPFKDIKKVFAVHDHTNKRSALVFENTHNFKNGDYGFSKTLFFDVLTFENVQDLELVIKILKKAGSFNISFSRKYQPNSLNEKLKGSFLYSKFLQLLSLIFLYLATNIGLKLMDSNWLSSNYVEAVVIAQKKKTVVTNYFYNHLETDKGYSFVLKGTHFYNHMQEPVGLYISPIFKSVIDYNFEKKNSIESLKNGYKGGVNIVFKIWAFLASFFSATYIFYKKNDIPIEDLTVFILFPIISVIFAFYYFQ